MDRQRTELSTGPARRRRLLSDRSRFPAGWGACPRSSANFPKSCPHRLCSRTSGFQSEKPGASPGGDATFLSFQSSVFSGWPSSMGRPLIKSHGSEAERYFWKGLSHRPSRFDSRPAPQLTGPEALPDFLRVANHNLSYLVPMIRQRGCEILRLRIERSRVRIPPGAFSDAPVAQR